MSSSNCCFLTCIQVSQEAGQVVWYSQIFQSFPQFIVIHTVRGFGIVNKAEIDVFLELSCFFNDPANVDNLISGSSAFPKTSLNNTALSQNLSSLNSCSNNFCVETLEFSIYSIISSTNWRRQWQPTPVLLPGKSHGRRSLVGCSPWGR